MKIRLISFTAQGAATASRLCEGLKRLRACPPRCGRQDFRETADMRERVEAVRFCDLKESGKSLSDFTREAFLTADGLIFVGAAGIAVRASAPYLKSKKEDPAVLVVDETGKYVIPILSGHIGGANELAREAAGILGALPVITTATDLRHAFAVDLFAVRNRLEIEDLQEAKRISAAALAGERIGFFSDYPTDGPIPEELSPGIWQDHNICVTQRDGARRPGLLRLVPRTAALGMGCRKGISLEAARKGAMAALKRCGLSRLSLCALATVEQKREEAALRALADEWRLAFACFPASALAAAEGVFPESEFVRKTVGVGNVCCRAAVVMAGGMGREDGSLPETSARGARLLTGKVISEGVTAAVAVPDEEVILHFQGEPL